MSNTVTRLRVGNEDFLVASMIERCPKTMMIRELLKNALEAAAGAEPGQRRVELRALPVEGVPKLAIWNSGRGLNGQELRRMCNIATSIHKEAGLDRNFGMGAKVASLPSNQHGMRYRSARDGVVREVVIGKYDGVYGRLLRPGPDGTPTEVLEVTAEAVAEGRDPGSDWTEVVLLGNAPGQNTVLDPYDRQPRVAAGWLLDAIRARFARLPADVEVVFAPGLGGATEPRRVTTVEDHLRVLPHYERVPGPDGILLHYGFDPALAAAPALPGQPEALAGLLHRDEFYAIQRGRGWLRESPSFGIPFLARAVTVLVELPDEYPVLPEAYRDFLRYRLGRQDRVGLHDFASMVVAHQPAWLAKLLSDAAPHPDYVDGIAAEMRWMMERLGVTRQRPRRRPATEAGPRLPREGVAAEAPLETPPAIILLRDTAEIADRGLAHRAGIYYPDTHQLHVNLAYAVVTKTARALVAGMPASAAGEEAVQEAARLAAEQAMVTRMVRGLVHGFAKRSQRQNWNEFDLRMVLSPEALTLAADHVETGWSEIEEAFRAALARAAPPQAA